MSALDRFAHAQRSPSGGYAAAFEEIRTGRKRGHWVWYIFPQLDGLGRSPMASEYAIKSLDEGVAFLQNDELRSHYLDISRAVADQLRAGKSLGELMGSDIDARKLVSSLTLFGRVAARLVERPGDDYSEIFGVAQEVLAVAQRQGFPVCAFTIRRLETA